MKIKQKKIVIPGFLIVVVILSSVVFLNPQLFSNLNIPFITKSPTNTNTNTSTTTNTNTNTTTNPTNVTLMSPAKLINKTSLPLTSPETQMGGGQQLADFYFGANIQSYSYTNMYFQGTVSNYTEGPNPTVNNFITLNFQPTITSCSFSYHDTYNYVSDNLNVSQSLTAGDINGNGKDEYIAAYAVGCKNQYSSQLTVLSWNSSSNSFYDFGPTINLGLYYPSVLALYAKSSSPIMQIVVAGFETPNATSITLKFIDYAPTGTNYPVQDASHMKIETFNLTNPGLPVVAQTLALERGDVFGTGSQEFLMYGKTRDNQSFALLYQYNATTHMMVKLHEWVDAILGRPIFARFLDIPAEQIVIPKTNPPTTMTSGCPGSALPNLNYTDESGFIYYFNIANYSVTKIAYLPYSGIVGAGNIDGNGQTSIILLHINNPAVNTTNQACPSYDIGTDITHVYTYNSAYPYSLTYGKGLYSTYPEDTSKFNIQNNYPTNSNLKNLLYVYPDKKIITGDVNYDGLTDFIYPSTGNINNYGYKYSNGLLFTSQPTSPYYSSQNVHHQYQPQDPTFPLDTWKFDLTGTVQTSDNMTFGNFFGDAVTLSYKSQVWDSVDNPTILAVIAAPPTVTNISQAYSKSYTSFGLSTSQSTTTGTSWGFTLGGSVIVGASVGITVPVFGETIAKFTEKFKVNFDYQSSHTSKSTHTIAFSQQWLTGYSDDAVVFAVITYRNWNYTLHDLLNPTLNGHTWTYRSPIAVTVQKFDLKAFNQLFPSYGLEKTFSHTLGNPASYPLTSQISSIATNSPIDFTPPTGDVVQVGEGQGATVEEIDVSNSVSQGSSISYKAGFTSTTTVQVGTAIVGVELRASYLWGSSYQFTQGSATKYISHVGNILNLRDWNKYHYTFELFAYVMKRSDISLSYQVINYAVGNLGTGLITTTTTTNASSTAALQSYHQTISTLNA